MTYYSKSLSESTVIKHKANICKTDWSRLLQLATFKILRNRSQWNATARHCRIPSVMS